MESLESLESYFLEYKSFSEGSISANIRKSQKCTLRSVYSVYIVLNMSIYLLVVLLAQLNQVSLRYLCIEQFVALAQVLLIGALKSRFSLYLKIYFLIRMFPWILDINLVPTISLHLTFWKSFCRELLFPEIYMVSFLLSEI